MFLSIFSPSRAVVYTVFLSAPRRYPAAITIRYRSRISHGRPVHLPDVTHFSPLFLNVFFFFIPTDRPRCSRRLSPARPLKRDDDDRATGGGSRNFQFHRSHDSPRSIRQTIAFRGEKLISFVLQTIVVIILSSSSEATGFRRILGIWFVRKSQNNAFYLINAL